MSKKHERVRIIGALRREIDAGAMTHVIIALGRDLERQRQAEEGGRPMVSVAEPAA